MKKIYLISLVAILFSGKTFGENNNYLITERHTSENLVIDSTFFCLEDEKVLESIRYKITTPSIDFVNDIESLFIFVEKFLSKNETYYFSEDYKCNVGFSTVYGGEFKSDYATIEYFKKGREIYIKTTLTKIKEIYEEFLETMRNVELMEKNITYEDFLNNL